MDLPTPWAPTICPHHRWLARRATNCCGCSSSGKLEFQAPGPHATRGKRIPFRHHGHAACGCLAASELRPPGRAETRSRISANLLSAPQRRPRSLASSASGSGTRRAGGTFPSTNGLFEEGLFATSQKHPHADAPADLHRHSGIGERAVGKHRPELPQAHEDPAPPLPSPTTARSNAHRDLRPLCLPCARARRPPTPGRRQRRRHPIDTRSAIRRPAGTGGAGCAGGY